MKNMRKLLTMMLMVSSVFFIACEDDEDTTQNITGKWYLYQTIEVETEGGETYTDEWTYDQNIDPDFFSASFLEITTDNIIFYDNDLGSYYETESNPYVINGSKIITTYVDEGEIEIDTATYHFDGDMLVVVATYEEEGYSETYTTKLKPYQGVIPPDSWTTALVNDNYEPDNEYASATTINLDEQQSHVTIVEDADWFKFDGIADETYLIEISGYMDNYMYLYDTDGMTLIDEDDDNDYDVEIETSYWGNPVILWNCTTSGAYYFEVTGLGSYTEGYYSVEITKSNLTNKSKTQIDKKNKKKIAFFKI